MNSKTVKVRQKARIRPDLNINGLYMWSRVGMEMIQYAGKEITIIKVLPWGDVFKIDADHGGYLWNVDMLDLSEPKKAEVKKVEVKKITMKEIEEKFGWPVVILDYC